MIEATYHRQYHRLTLTGHAGSGEYGHDLVCAAVSALAYTLGVAVINAETAGQLREKTVKLESGDVEIACKPINRWKSVTTVIFDSVCAGFDLLAQQYPENMHYEVLG